MRVGWIGLGKLGLPCALALAKHGGHEVAAYDRDQAALDVLKTRLTPPRIEAGLVELLYDHQVQAADSVASVVRHTDDLIFVAVPTPHGEEYGGERPMPDERADFDYEALRDVTREVAKAATEQDKRVTLVVISTALPGTMDREVVPLLGAHVDLVYNPFFIAMGTTVYDYLHPEFVLLGMPSYVDPVNLVDLYSALVPGVPILAMGLREAELTKVAYNTFISLKIVFANTLMEICSKLDANVDHVSKALSFANRRVVSPAYLRGGMGDGGACHPRDNIAMSWLAEELELAVDPFDFVSRARELQTQWLADEVVRLAHAYDLPVVLLGRAYKPGSDLTYGSPALLLAHYLSERQVEILAHWDPYVDGGSAPAEVPAVYVLATQHEEFAQPRLPAGSVLVDPFRCATVDPAAGVQVVRIGGIGG